MPARSRGRSAPSASSDSVRAAPRRGAQSDKAPRLDVAALASKLGLDPRTVAKVARAVGGGEKIELSRGDVVGPGGNVGQFWTPSWLAQAFVRWCGIRRGTRVLDAGSGMGALSLAALDAGARVTAIEIDERLVARTAPLLEPRGATLVHRDFLAPVDRRQIEIEAGHGFEVAISNPVWEGDMPERFLERMLSLAPRAAGIVPLNMLAGVERAKFWRHVEIVRARFLPRRPNFGGPSGGKRDVMLIEIAARATPRGPGDADYPRLELGE